MDSYLKFRIISGIVGGIIAIIIGAYILISAIIVNYSRNILEGALIIALGIIGEVICIVIVKKNKKIYKIL